MTRRLLAFLPLLAAKLLGQRKKNLYILTSPFGVVRAPSWGTDRRDAVLNLPSLTVWTAVEWDRAARRFGWKTSAELAKDLAEAGAANRVTPANPEDYAPRTLDGDTSGPPPRVR